MINKTCRHLCAALVATVGLASLQVSASAAFIEGAIGFGGLFNPTGGAGLGDATGIDIYFSQVVAASGDFVPAVGNGATFAGLAFNPANTPVTPLWSVTSGMTNFSFDLFDITVDSQTATQLNLSGTGTLMATGFDDTAGTWTFSGNTAGIVLFSFSSISVAQGVPVPATLMLMGIGLLGFRAASRKRA